MYVHTYCRNCILGIYMLYHATYSVTYMAASHRRQRDYEEELTKVQRDNRRLAMYTCMSSPYAMP